MVCALSSPHVMHDYLCVGVELAGSLLSTKLSGLSMAIGSNEHRTIECVSQSTPCGSILTTPQYEYGSICRWRKAK